MAEQDNHPVLGAHFSVAGGLEKALTTAWELKCRAAQIFTKNARSWKEPDLSVDQVARFQAMRKKTGMVFVASHCSYLINVASPDTDKRTQSMASLVGEMKRSGRLGLDAVVLHPGAHLGHGIEAGLIVAGQTLKDALSRDEGDFPQLLLETTAGTGTSLGSSFEELGALLSALPPRVGICLDTCHIFAAGYDLRTPEALDQVMDEFQRHMDISRLALVHLNDARPKLGSRKDRHTHIGMGEIGTQGFRAVMQHPLLAKIPKIIETPKELDKKPMDPVNLKRLRQLAH
jgi:deoxyribonuclease-4